MWSRRAWRRLCAGLTRHTIRRCSSLFFFTKSRSIPCSLSYSSSQALNTSKHDAITFSNSSYGMCIKRRVPRTCGIKDLQTFLLNDITFLIKPHQLLIFFFNAFQTQTKWPTNLLIKLIHTHHPDMTFAVHWALKTYYQSIIHTPKDKIKQNLCHSRI